MNEQELERVIAALIKRKDAAPNGSAERRMLERQLQGLRYSYEPAGGIIEELDPRWGSYSVRITGPARTGSRQRPGR